MKFTSLFFKANANIFKIYLKDTNEREINEVYFIIFQNECIKKKCAKRHFKHFAHFFLLLYRNYFTLATIALNASGLFIARSANTLRLISIPALWIAPISCE